MERFLRLVREIHRRSIWQVLGIYLVGSWGVLSVVDTLSGALGLPDWFPPFAFGLLIVGLPVVVATAVVQDSGAGRPGAADVPAQPSPATGASGLFTWPRALGGGVLAFALWGVVAAAWVLFGGARSTGTAAEVLAAVSAVERAADRGEWVEAFRLAEALPRAVPDSVRDAIASSVSRTTSFLSEPPGASVSWRPYDSPDAEFEAIGTTPFEWPGPRAAVQVLFELDGYVPQTLGFVGYGVDHGPKLRRVDGVLPNALYVPARMLSPAFVEARLAHAVPPGLDEYLIDRYEVTNREYMEFVDAGGYENELYWKHPFRRDGSELTWEEAMAEFVDLTGRPGPSTWTAGTFPSGEEDHPVTGLSWYEAAAYAQFSGRALPTLYHWSLAALPLAGQWTVPFSNLNGEGLAPVGAFPGISPFGAHDMAGNAREWLVNATGDQRYTAGGGWNDPPWLFSLTQPQPPFDRSETNGVRLMTDLGDPDEFARLSQPVEPVVRDFYSEEPASDELFAQLAAFYEYEDSPLDPRIVAVDTLPDAVRETITFDAAYGGERMTLYLFRPPSPTGPLQTILMFPGSGALAATEFGDFGGAQSIISMLVRSGRAVAYPVFESTFDRQDDYVYRLQDPSNEHRDHVIHWRQDLGRSLDYLETRPDVDAERFGYLGASWGGRMSAIMLSVDDRFSAATLVVPGLSPLPTQPVVDPFNFVSRVRLPVLMLSGEYDQTYPLETSARPFFDFLGTDEADKKHFIAAGGHLIPAVDLTRETLDWFDRYLGRVR